MYNTIFFRHKILCAAFLLFCLFNPPVQAAPEAEKLLPGNPGLAGWQMAGNYYHYLPENLYRYINGAADMFNSYGFITLLGAEYVSQADEQENMIVDVYDMGKKLNAFAIFQSKRDPASTALKVGAGSFGNDQYLVFYKDRFYVEIQSVITSDRNRNIPVMMAQRVAGMIAGDTAPPTELRYFPDAGRVPGSELYITGGILGYAFLDKGLVSDYKLVGEKVKAFVAFFSSKQDALTGFNRYKTFLDESGKKWQKLKGFGEEGFTAQDPYHKNILVAQMGPFIVGVADLSLAQKGEALLRSILAKLKQSS